MTSLAQAIRAASEDALLKVSLESLATEMATAEVSLEQQIEDINTMSAMAHSLDNVVVTFESFDNPTPAQHSFARDQALSILTMSGLSEGEAAGIFPSMEAESSSGWEKFKAFLQRLWDFIVAAAKKIFEFVQKVLQRSSLAERAAMSKLRLLRQSAKKVRQGVTIDAKIKLRPGHRYLFDNKGKLDDYADLKRNVENFLSARNTVQEKFPQVLLQVAKDMVAAVDKLALKGDDAQVSASIIANKEALRSAAGPMFPGALARKLGFTGQQLPLTYDRVVTINKPLSVADERISDEELATNIAQFGLSVEQVEVQALNADSMGSFPALRMNEIDELLKLAERLIDTGHSADQQRQWGVLKIEIDDLKYAVGGAVKAVLQKPGLEQDARLQLKVVLNASRAMSQWINAPFVQLNIINVRVVDSLLAMAEDQLKNYELTDGMEERLDKAASERKKSEKKDDKK